MTENQKDKSFKRLMTEMEKTPTNPIKVTDVNLTIPNTTLAGKKQVKRKNKSAGRTDIH